MQHKTAGSGNESFYKRIDLSVVLTAFFISVVFLLTATSHELQAQNDTLPRQIESAGEVEIDTVRPHSPHKATIYSMVLPGLGQAYNKKYWKIPIIYAGFGAFGYFIHDNTKEYRKFREAYEYVVNEETGPIPNPYVDRYEEEALKRGRDYYRRNMEVSYIFSGFWYIINVLDATVDAHFYDYNVTDDLTLEVGPAVQKEWYGPRQYGGVSLTLKLNP